MGLLVGLLCEDGVVIGSDSARPTRATGPSGPCRNTHVIGGDLVLAATGNVGLAQRLGAVLRGLREDSRFHEWDHFAIARAIAAETLRDFAATRSDLAGFGALLGFACVTGFHLCEFSPGALQPEFKTPDAWFAAMGPGGATAGSLLGLFGRTLPGRRRPDLEDGTFAAAWALDHAMQLHPDRVLAPVQMAVLAARTDDASHPARLLAPDEVAECLQRVRRAEEQLGPLLRPDDK